MENDLSLNPATTATHFFVDSRFVVDALFARPNKWPHTALTKRAAQALDKWPATGVTKIAGHLKAPHEIEFHATADALARGACSSQRTETSASMRTRIPEPSQEAIKILNAIDMEQYRRWRTVNFCAPKVATSSVQTWSYTDTSIALRWRNS